MNLLDRFSTHLRDVLVRSIRLASELGHAEVEPIHLLFALSAQKGSVGTEILTRFKVKGATIENILLTIPSVNSKPTTKNTVKSEALSTLSLAAKTALEKAMIIAQENQHNYVGTEHLLTALIRQGDEYLKQVFLQDEVKMNELEEQLQIVLGNATQFPQITEMAEAVENLQDALGESMDNPPLKKPLRKKESLLDFFATNLTNPEIQKNIDPVIGRDKEIERLIQILSRRTKNNPILLGDPGVGKTAIVEGLAKKILEGQVPSLLLNKKIYALDMSLMIAGTIYRGEFEARLRQVMEEISRDPNIVLFIDEIHNIVGAGSNQGTMDAANILKPVLARGQIRCIGATTTEEFKKHIENDAALERRFQPIIVRESNLEDAVKIIQGIKGNYEVYHGVEITDEAITAAVRLADKYISNKYLPDKAIDIIDETAAAKRLAAKTPAWQDKLWRLKQKLDKVTLDKETAAGRDNFEQAVKLKKEEDKLREEIKKTEKLGLKQKNKTNGVITPHDVAIQLGKIIGVKPSELMLSETERLKNLASELKEHIVGQDQTIEEVTNIIRQAELGLTHPERPLASFLFVGPSGVGKTELAKSIAKVVYPGHEALIKLDMSEFNEGFSVSKLLGSPAGYIGYKESNQFTDKLKMNPHSVVLFDEIDKAHRDVIKLLLQILENGEITDATGKKISLRHAIVILTTTHGAEEIDKKSLGFGEDNNGTNRTQDRLKQKLKEFFTPEIINRLDSICLFNTLTPNDLIGIAEKEIRRLNDRLKTYTTSISPTPESLTWFIKNKPDKKMTARDLRREINNDVEKLIASLILRQKNLKKEYQLTIKENALTLE